MPLACDAFYCRALQPGLRLGRSSLPRASHPIPALLALLALAPASAGPGTCCTASAAGVCAQWPHTLQESICADPAPQQSPGLHRIGLHRPQVCIVVWPVTQLRVQENTSSCDKSRAPRALQPGLLIFYLIIYIAQNGSPTLGTCLTLDVCCGQPGLNGVRATASANCKVMGDNRRAAMPCPCLSLELRLRLGRSSLLQAWHPTLALLLLLVPARALAGPGTCRTASAEQF